MEILKKNIENQLFGHFREFIYFSKSWEIRPNWRWSGFQGCLKRCEKHKLAYPSVRDVLSHSWMLPKHHCFWLCSIWEVWKKLSKIKFLVIFVNFSKSWEIRPNWRWSGFQGCLERGEKHKLAYPSVRDVLSHSWRLPKHHFWWLCTIWKFW